MTRVIGRAREGLLVVAVLLSGCGQPSTPRPEAKASRSSAKADLAAVPTQPPDPETVRQAVRDFLKAIQAGDSKSAQAMLTPLTREKTREMGVDVAPPGSPTAQFEIGEVEFRGDHGAYVATKWIDADGAGGQRADDVVWMVKRVDEGWRICGLGAKVFEDQPPLFLNFEDPQEMARKQAAVEAERLRRAKAEAVPPAETGKLR